MVGFRTWKVCRGPLFFFLFSIYRISQPGFKDTHCVRRKENNSELFVSRADIALPICNLDGQERKVLPVGWTNCGTTPSFPCHIRAFLAPSPWINLQKLKEKSFCDLYSKWYSRSGVLNLWTLWDIPFELIAFLMEPVDQKAEKIGYPNFILLKFMNYYCIFV